MLTGQQAIGAADALVHAESTSRARERDERARTIPWFLRIAPLVALPKREQAQLVAQARRSALMNLQGAALVLSWSALVALVAWLLWPQRTPPVFWLVLGGVAVVGVQLRMVLVRARLFQLLLDRSASEHGGGA